MNHFGTTLRGEELGVMFAKVCPRETLPNHSEVLVRGARLAFSDGRMADHYRLQQEARKQAREEGRSIFSLGV